LDILSYVNASVAKLSSWMCGDKLIKASWHLKDKLDNKKLSKSQKYKPNIAWNKARKTWKTEEVWLSQEEETSNKNWILWFSLSFFRKKGFDNSQIFMIKYNLGKICL